MSMDNVTLENTQQSISSRDAKSVASVMVNGKWVNLSDTLEQANVKSDVGTVSKQVAEQQTVITSAVAQADSAVAYANDAIEKSRVNSQAIVEINSAVSDAVSDAAVARSDGLRAWDAAQSNVDLIDLNYASASAAISSARTEAIAAADEAKKSASAAQADIVAVRSDVAAVQADVTANKSDVATAKSNIAVIKTNLASQAKSLSSYASQASAAGKDITVLKSQVGQFEQDMADTKGDVSQLKVSASSASVALSDAIGNISSLQASAKSYSAALSDTNSNVATVTATASELETKYADAAGDINRLQTDAKGMTQTISNAQGDIAKLKTRADGFDTEFADTNGNISKLQTDASGTKQTLTNAKSDIAVLQSRADGFDTKYADVAGDINKLQVDASGMKQTLTDAKGDISTLQATATGFKNTLTDAQGNISTLQSDVAGLKKTTSDHAGNIATLQADAKTLTSQMSSAQGDISTLKQTASGFSSQVSGMETSLANANSKIDSMQIGGRNLLTNTDKDISVTSHTTDGYPAWANIDTGFSFEHGKMYTFSAEAKNSTDKIAEASIRVFEYSTNTQVGIYAFPADGERHSVTFTIPNDSHDYHLLLYAGHAGIVPGVNVTTTYHHRKLEFGNIATDWSPAPEDTDAKITTNSTAIDQNKKAIALKADQTVVDKTNGTVQRLQSQLKVQADQINAKVSSSDLDAKGYATQTYTQTLVTQKANEWNLNLTSLKTDVNAIKTTGGGVNLLTGTSGDLQTKQFTNSWNVGPQATNGSYQIKLVKGQKYTYRAWIDNTNGSDTAFVNVRFAPIGGTDFNLGNGTPIKKGETGYSTLLITPPEDGYASFVPFAYGASETFSAGWKEEMLEEGTVAHTWSPAPSDMATVTSVTNLSATVDGIQAQVYNKDGSSRITQLSNLIATKVSSSDFDKLSKNVELQTLDSADINSMRTSGHYFVHNLANTPIQGWVYVDVVGNGNDRIRQDVYQDSGIEHKYRRWFATHWTDWEEGATESEIIQLSDDINIRVKKGNVVSQINQEAGGNTLIQVANGQGKLALNASSVVFSGSAFIPDAYITTLNADKLRFYDDSGNVATMSAGLKQYDDDKAKKTIVLQYAGGYEVHASDLLGSILTMHDNTIRLAVKAHGNSDMGSKDQYSGFYAMSHYAQLSCYRTDGRAPGIYITDDGYTIKGDYSGNGTKYGDLNITSPQIYVQGGNSVSLSGGNAVQMQVNNTHAWLSDSMLHLYKDGDGGSTATQLRVEGWAWINGWVEAAGHSQHSALSTKTDIQSVDDEKMLKMVNDTDLTTFLYKTDIANGETHRHIGLIIDDVHDVAQYQTPQEFIAPNGVSRDDDNMIGALFGAVKALTKRIKTLESKVG